jgi:hypothetical protein
VQARHPLLAQYLSMDQHRTFAFQKSDYEGDAIFGRYHQTHVDVVRHQMPLDQFHSTLSAQITQYLSYSCSKFAVQLFLSKLGHKYDVVFAIPSDMR